MVRESSHLRAGTHTEEGNVTDGEPSGPPIRVATRVAALADPDEVLVTRTVRDLIAGTHLGTRTRAPGEARQSAVLVRG
jgi:class 3 adenylate cyclase